MRLLLIALLALALAQPALAQPALAQPARADIYDDLSGVFESFDYPGETCVENPVSVSFSADHRRVAFSWARPVPSYTGGMITAFAGSVVARQGDSLVMLRDGEQRLDPQGNQVMWIMSPMTPVQGFCWSRTDWPQGTCLINLRCPAVPNS